MSTGLLFSILILVSASDPPPSPSPLLFTSFRGNGEDGLHLAWSRDGYTWTPLKQDLSFLEPEVGGGLMRDPCIRRGPDGTFHMVWTTAWNERGFGYANSKDLIHWSGQRFIPINEKIEGVRNTWAPELFYDYNNRKWLIIWSSTIVGKFPESENGDGGYNHRMYFTETTDFNEFSPAALYYDPGFNCIDGTLIADSGRYILVFKDERIGQKCLRMAESSSPTGPFGPPSDPFSGDWVEGPSAIHSGNDWFVYFDHYVEPEYYGALKTKDWKSWENESPRMSFPKNFRHGTVIEIDENLLSGLLAVKP